MNDVPDFIATVERVREKPSHVELAVDIREGQRSWRIVGPFKRREMNLLDRGNLTGVLMSFEGCRTNDDGTIAASKARAVEESELWSVNGAFALRNAGAGQHTCEAVDGHLVVEIEVEVGLWKAIRIPRDIVAQVLRSYESETENS